jgi:hypothetical protein
MKIAGKTWSRLEIERRAGSVAQLGGTRWCELADGRGRGMRTIEVDADSGLAFSVLPDRGMDIGRASWRGIPLVFFDGAAEAHPAFFDPAGSEWLRGFSGGMVTTCGLSSFGAPGRDGPEDLGLHGRIANTPAVRVADLSGWEGDEYVVRLRGTLEEGVMFGARLRMVRTISVTLGGNVIHLEDEAENVGPVAAPFVILYHINPGFPLLDASSVLALGARSCTSYDEHSEAGFAQRFAFEAPRDGWKEQNYLHLMTADAEGAAHVMLWNPLLGDGMALTISFLTSTLPWLSEWKNLAPRDYVIGLEPCNAPIRNRAELRRRGELPELQPGETRRMSLDIGILEGREAIEGKRRQIALLQD